MKELGKVIAFDIPPILLVQWSFVDQDPNCLQMNIS